MSDVLHRVRTDRRVAIALVLAVLFLIAWVAWTVYVWSENGSAAGIGVLVSWPAVLLALGVVASPFVAVAWFLRSRDEGEAAGLEDGDEADDDEDSDDEDAPEEDAEEESSETGAEGEPEEDADEDPEPAKKPKAKRKAKSKKS